MVAQSLLHHLDMRFIITFTLLLFYICCTKGNDKELELKNYTSNVNENFRNSVHSQPLNETIHHGYNLNENLLSDMNTGNGPKLNKPMNRKILNNYLRTFANANSRHKSSLNKKSTLRVKKPSQRKMKKKKAIRRISREESRNELRVPLEDTNRKKYSPLFNVGNDKLNLNDHSTSHFNDDTNYQLNQSNSELNLKKYFSSYFANEDGDHQLYQYDSKLSLKKYPMYYSDADDDNLNKELKLYVNGNDYSLYSHVRSKFDLYEYLMSQIKSKNKKLKQRKVKKKKINKKVSRVTNSEELAKPLEDTSTKKKIDLSSTVSNEPRPNDYSISYANDDVNYQLNQNESEFNRNKFFASYSVNTEGDHLFYQHNSKLNLQKHSMLYPYADDRSLKKDLNLNGNEDNYYPINMDIRTKPRRNKYLSSKIRNKSKQRRVKKGRFSKKIFRKKSSDELRELFEDTTTNIENNKPTSNDNSEAYVSDDFNYQLNQNKSELNLKNNFVLYSVNGDGDHQSLQNNSIPSLEKYAYPKEDDQSLKKDLLLHENGDKNYSFNLHTRSKPSIQKYLMSLVRTKNAKKLKKRLMKKRKSSKKISRVESSDELREPLDDTSKNKYLRLSITENNKPSSNNGSELHGNGNINYQLNQNKSIIDFKNDSIPYSNRDDFKTNQNNSKINLKNDSVSHVNEENYQSIDQYTRSHPSIKKSHWKPYNAKRLKPSKLKNKRTHQKIFRVDNRNEQPFKDLTRKNFLRLFKIRNSKSRPNNYMNMIFLSDKNRQNKMGKLHSPKHYDETYKDHVMPDLKKSLQLLKNAANLFQESDSSMHDTYHYDGHDRSLNLNLFLLNQVMERDTPHYNTFSDLPKDYNDQLNLKYQVLPTKNKNNPNQQHKSGLKVDNMSYDKDRQIFSWPF